VLTVCSDNEIRVGVLAYTYVRNVSLNKDTFGSTVPSRNEKI